MEKLQKVWQKALDLAKEHLQNRLSEVVRAIAEHFVRAGQHKEAARLHLEVDDHKEAADVYIMGGHWEEARKVAATFGQQQLFQHIESLYKEHLLKKGEAGLLVSIGRIPEALEVYLEKEDWGKVHELSGQLGPEVQKHFAARHAAHCLKNSKVLEAVSLLSRYGLPDTSDGLQICRLVASELLHSYNDSPVSVHALQELRTLLYKHLQSVKDSISSSNQQALEELEVFVLPLTYMAHRFACQWQGLKELAAKLSVSLLRYIEHIPADKAFYDAGIACKEVSLTIGWEDKAFVYMNQYLDIAEAIDDEDTRFSVDNPTFENTDIPHSFPISRNHFVDTEKQEAVQEWVIQFSVNRQVDKSLISTDCENCGHSVYEASLICFYCKMQSKARCVTGFPLQQQEDAQRECRSCHMLANKCDWMAYTRVFLSCPWCYAPVQQQQK